MFNNTIQINFVTNILFKKYYFIKITHLPPHTRRKKKAVIIRLKRILLIFSNVTNIPAIYHWSIHILLEFFVYIGLIARSTSENLLLSNFSPRLCKPQICQAARSGWSTDVRLKHTYSLLSQTMHSL